MPSPHKTMNIEIILLIVLVSLAIFAGIGKSIVDRIRNEHVVWQHQLGLHFIEGRFIEQLAPGKHVFWGRGHDVIRFDGRAQELVVQGQDLINASL